MSTEFKKDEVVKENARSVAGRELPPVPEGVQGGTILLFYQYREPAWTNSEHKKALKQVLAIAAKHSITGRGRVATEGANCTLSSSNPLQMRAFCQALRDWDPVFNETDFKLTDGIPHDKLFKSLSIRKAKELVAYGLDGGDKAPSLEKFAGEHLEAAEYHEAMMDKDTVIIDVRNAYESAIGSFRPPPGGAELIDPKMRNSIEWPKWLADPQTQAKLHDKKVLMYCTGGIRCERATALLNEMTAVSSEIKPKAVFELRGGIERYIKSYPTGGFWKGKNYLFDRRQEQVPAQKTLEEVEAEIDACCCVCRQKWTVYRGKFKCSQSMCGVPVIVCDSCREYAGHHPQTLNCQLCKEGYKAPRAQPDLVGLKRQAEEKAAEGVRKKQKLENGAQTCPDRLFISRLPLTINKGRLSGWLGEIQTLHWLTDKKTGAFYGSCIVELKNPDVASAVVSKTTPKFDKKKPKVALAESREEWPPTALKDSEFPPIGG
jgi:predicted sulfurtransferase